MNFLSGELRDTAGKLTAEGAGFSLPLPDSTRDRLNGRARKDVVVGVRPAAFAAGGGAGNAGGILTLPVLVSEYIGASSIVISRCGDQRVVLEIKSEDRVQPGGEMKFHIAPESVHLFDPQDGRAI